MFEKGYPRKASVKCLTSHAFILLLKKDEAKI